MHQFSKPVLDSPVMGAQGIQDLAELLPTFHSIATFQPMFGILARGNDQRDNDVAQLLPPGPSHDPAHRLYHVHRALSRLEKGHRRQPRAVGSFSKDSDVRKGMGLVRGSCRQLAKCGVSGFGTVSGIPVFNLVWPGNQPLFPYLIFDPLPNVFVI